MRINWLGYWQQNDGYGRFNTRMVSALQKAGMDVQAIHIGDLDRPTSLLDQMFIDWKALTISCIPPHMLKRRPHRQWLYSMTEGSLIPPLWVHKIMEADVERVIVPCEHNAKAFRDSGVRVPIHVVPGGTDPSEFFVWHTGKVRLEDYRPYTFLTFVDRGDRKGWKETWDAFYHAFGGKTTGNQEVRLILKVRKGSSNADLMEMMKGAREADHRLIYQIDDTDNIYDTLAQADCLVLPSRSEGWGMIQREAACMGIPVITQAYAGLDDGHTKEWALIAAQSHMEDIPKEVGTALGQWSIASVEDIAQKMKYCFYSPETAAGFGKRAAQWIRKNQTWDGAGAKLLDLVFTYTYNREMVRG